MMQSESGHAGSMEKKMTRALPLLIAVSVLLAGCGLHMNPFAHLKGSGKLASESREVKGFTRIRLAGSTDCVVRVGGPFSVTITADDNILKIIRTEVVGETLEIEAEKPYSCTQPIKVEITLPKLLGYSISGSGDAEISGVDSEAFEASISGSGDLTVSGRVDSLDASISGSGDMNLTALEAKRAEASIAGSGTIKLYATEALDASIAGSGDIRYLGGPKDVSKSVAGSGEVEPES